MQANDDLIFCCKASFLACMLDADANAPESLLSDDESPPDNVAKELPSLDVQDKFPETRITSSAASAAEANASGAERIGRRLRNQEYKRQRSQKRMASHLHSKLTAQTVVHSSDKDLTNIMAKKVLPASNAGYHVLEMGDGYVALLRLSTR